MLDRPTASRSERRAPESNERGGRYHPREILAERNWKGAWEIIMDEGRGDNGISNMSVVPEPKTEVEAIMSSDVRLGEG